MSSQDQQTFNDWKGGFKQSEPQARAADQQGKLAEHAHDMAGSAVDATVNDRAATTTHTKTPVNAARTVPPSLKDSKRPTGTFPLPQTHPHQAKQ